MSCSPDSSEISYQPTLLIHCKIHLLLVSVWLAMKPLVLSKFWFMFVNLFRAPIASLFKRKEEHTALYFLAELCQSRKWTISAYILKAEGRLSRN